PAHLAAGEQRRDALASRRMEWWILIADRPEVLLLTRELRERDAGEAPMVAEDRGDIGVPGDDVGVVRLVDVDGLFVAQGAVQRIRVVGPLTPAKAGQVRRRGHFRSGTWICQLRRS